MEKYQKGQDMLNLNKSATPTYPLLGLLLTLPDLAGAEDYYVKSKGYRVEPLPDPPAYVRNLSRTQFEQFRDVDWLDVGLDFRTRYEYRENDLRPWTDTSSGAPVTRYRDRPDNLWLLRTRAYLGVKDILDPLRFAVEMEDARSYNGLYERSDADVNEFELIQGYAELYFNHALGHNRPISLRAGRMHFEQLDRRLIGNNEFRNTTNNFEGFRLHFGKKQNTWDFDTFALQPVKRLKYEFDRPEEKTWFYGGILSLRRWSDIVTIQPYFLGRSVDGEPFNPVAADRVNDRNVLAPGLRVYSVIPNSGFDFAANINKQFGDSGITRTIDGQLVQVMGNHAALAYSLELGYSFDQDWKPRLSGYYGFGTGDRDPNEPLRRDEFTGVTMSTNFLKKTLNKLIPFRVRQAHHERNQLLAVRPEPVEGLNQSFLKSTPHPSLVGLLAIGLFFAAGNGVLAAEKKKYRRPPFSVFSSQMPDALLDFDVHEKPVWNLHDALDLPQWLSLSVEQRTRYETMDGQFRAGSVGGDQQIALQTGAWLQASLGAFRLGGEFLDARAVGADSGSWINNTHANTADFLQGYLAWADPDLLHSGIGAEVIAGRQTLNFGSRRLAARNAFRNTINSFTGGRLRLLDDDRWQLNAFVTMPLQRLPTATDDILNDVHEFDEAATHTLFSGAFLEWYELPLGINAEVYLYHLDEGDAADNPTRNRRYFTPGLRLYLLPATGEADFQWETIGQFGTVRASAAATDSRDLTHKAWFQHINAGYSFDAPWSPRLALKYDYASGDENPDDHNSGRFDTLYGARRFDYGPTGMYGAFARSNINAPGYVIQVAPRPGVQVVLNHQAFWLASDTDSWTTADLRDRTGATDNFIGHQTDLSLRWDINSSLNVETGWTRLFKGEFAQQAALAPDPTDIDYFYVGSMLRF